MPVCVWARAVAHGHKVGGLLWRAGNTLALGQGGEPNISDYGSHKGNTDIVSPPGRHTCRREGSVLGQQQCPRVGTPAQRCCDMLLQGICSLLRLLLHAVGPGLLRTAAWLRDGWRGLLHGCSESLQLRRQLLQPLHVLLCCLRVAIRRRESMELMAEIIHELRQATRKTAPSPPGTAQRAGHLMAALLG